MVDVDQNWNKHDNSNRNVTVGCNKLLFHEAETVLE